MDRTTVSIPGELLDQLRRIAADLKTSMASLIRAALEEKISRYRPRPRSLGLGASGHRDTARRIGKERPEPRTWR